MNLRDRVFESFTCAMENGYFREGEELHKATVDFLIQDAQRYDADLEKHTAEELRPHIIEWLQAHSLPVL